MINKAREALKFLERWNEENNKIKKNIMNMYTNPDYRRQGIAFKTLDLLVTDARKKGITAISLEATDMGRPLYEKYGFRKMNDVINNKAHN